MPVIRADTLYADVIYVAHSAGVARVRLNWLAKLTQMIDNEDEQGNSLSLPFLSLSYSLCSSPLSLDHLLLRFQETR
jgi:hypothetical protein